MLEMHPRMVILSVCLMPSCGNLYLRIKPEERSRLVQTFKLTEVRFSISPAHTSGFWLHTDEPYCTLPKNTFSLYACNTP